MTISMALHRLAAQAEVVELGFCGEVVDFYHRYRRGYPAAVIDSLMALSR